MNCIWNLFGSTIKSVRKLFCSSSETAKNINSYNAAVFFVDILGFSALTKGEVSGITIKDYEAWNVDPQREHPNSYLAATILVEFREALCLLKKYKPTLHVAEISDCAFIWSENVSELIEGVHFFMWTAIKDKGILCRGGMAYGEVLSVENENDELGAFVVGDAVTRAVKNEGRMKGPRVTMDIDFPHAVWSNISRNSCINDFSSDLFHPIQSEINMDTIDEYRWYLCDADFIATQKYPPGMNERIELTQKRLTIANVLKYHPRMGWNSRSKDGKIQLQAGELSISKNELLGVLHFFETQEVLDNDLRSIVNVQRADQRVKNDSYFSLDEKDKWQQVLEGCD